MSDNKNTATALDDERRVKVLSPGQLVAKRFFRNRLAMVGLIILVTMFVFSFIGGMVSPYGESEVFRKTEATWKDYAGAGYNSNFIFRSVDGQELPAAAQQKFILAVNKSQESFDADGVTYMLEKCGEDFYTLSSQQALATVLTLKGKSSFKEIGDATVTDAIKKAYEEASEKEETTFEADGQTYFISKSGREETISGGGEIALATKKVFNAAKADTGSDYAFEKEALLASEANASTFTCDGETYDMQILENGATEISKDGEIYATISNLLVSPQASGTFLSLEFKEAAEQAILAKEKTFTAADESGEEITYQLQNKNQQYIIRVQKQTTVNDTYHKPSVKHWLGTDGNGMDMLTRLMYGGRVSLVIGFIVVFISAFLGILLGGIAGYFGKWVDNLIMRIVDVFYCIPSTPLIIILGAAMDAMQLDPQIRMLYLMLVLGFLGWPSIARLVRGQILSLREQEFMTAAEACGIRASKRIFRHLVPNVIPQLIVTCTMSLGGTIITEATLSFLGLGVKFPFASWGNIINDVNNAYVMTNYWFIWIPAGICLLITVLGFNFVGDGLRDAFDPKMKR